MPELRVLIFDVDGTLVDSAGGVVATMRAAFRELGLAPPPEADVRAQIGLSLEVMFARLGVHECARHRADLIAAYKTRYREMREVQGSLATSPFFPGARAALDRLRSDPWTLLAVATGKSRRGMQALIADHALHGVFVSVQTADDHPSKPHPSMIEQVLRDTGAEAALTAMIGDTSYDMEMARAAGVATIGATWGYHPAAALDADRLIGDFGEIDAALNAVTGTNRNV